MSVRYLPYNQIDKQQWDNCIHQSLNRLIYPQSFYLDAMAENWDGLVLNDYEAVMPLCWRKKWGIAYLYQPAFFQQGGIYFTKELSVSTLQSFINMAFSHFKFAEITFNYLNDLAALPGYAPQMRNNYVLALSKPYNEIASAYPGSISKNLKRVKNFNLQYQVTDDYPAILKLYEKLYTQRINSFSKEDYNNFLSVCKILSTENNLICRQVMSNNNQLLAALILLKDNNRLYNIISCVTNEGRNAEANYFMYDKLIQEFCNSTYILDFEGSDVKGIAEFYSRFMSKNEQYSFLKQNNLHPLLKLFKR